MKSGDSVQIQAVLYHTNLNVLLRSLRSIDCAAKAAAERGVRVSLLWGDASETPLLSKAQWEELHHEGAHLERMECRYFHENTGYGKGNNLLAQGSQEDYLLIMNPEILLPPSCISDFLEPFRDETVGIVEARQIPVEHPKEYDPATMATEWSSGACFMIPSRLFKELQGFDDEHFFMYCEDVDLSWRVRLSGRKLYYQPLCGVFHARNLSESGRNIASLTEQKYTVLSEAVLAYKWSYPEYAGIRIGKAVERGDPGSSEALEAFQNMKKKAQLPDFLDPEHRVAHIIQYPESGGMLFTKHRYQL